MAGLFETSGAQPKNPSRGKPITPALRFETGLFTNRSALHDPAQFVISKFYQGYQDTLIDGSNMEITNKLTLARRPGLSRWSSVTVPDQPNWFYDWRTLDQGVKVVVDTPVATYLQTATTQTQIFTKSAGAGQGYYQGVADTLYYGDGVDLQKYDGTNVWNWGIVSPTAAPGLVVTEVGNVATPWAASTEFMTMGLIIDSNNNVQQLINVNADLSNPNSQSGLSGNGQPQWNATPGATTSDNTVTWTNWGPVVAWTPSTVYSSHRTGGNNVDPCFVYDPASDTIWGQDSPNGASGTSGVNRPAFKLSSKFVSDNNISWIQVNFPTPVQKGAVFAWKPAHAYPQFSSGNRNYLGAVVEPALLPAPSNQPVYIQVSTTAGTSGAAGTQPFQPNVSIGTTTFDNQLAWMNLGSANWQQNHSYGAWSSSGAVFGVVKDTNGNMQVCTTTGVSAATQPQAQWKASFAYGLGNTIVDSAGRLQTVTTAGTSGGTPPTWATVLGNTTTDNTVTWTAGAITGVVAWGLGYGTTTTDGTAIWTNVGPPVTWVQSTLFFLPKAGFSPPSASSPFGGASIVDSNNNVQFTISSGKSGTVHPTWAAVGLDTAEGSPLTLTQVTVNANNVIYTGTITGGASNAFRGQSFVIAGFAIANNNGLINVIASTATSLICNLNQAAQQANETHAGTASNSLVWFDTAAFSANSLSWTKGYQWAISYVSRTSDDIFNTTAPPGVANPLGPPTGSMSGGISTASPLATITGPNNGAIVTLSGLGSTDPQVDTIIIWRTLDGGSTLFFLTEINNPAPIGGQAQPWSFQDFQPDTIVDEFETAPIDHQNDPPPAGFLPMAYHFERIWGAVGNFVFVSGGADVVSGNPNESFDPEDFFEFPSPVTRIVPTATGILVFLTSDVYAILGGPLFDTFFPSPMVPGVGLLHYNALDIHGGVIFLYTADNQFISMDPSGGAQRMGGPVADKLQAFDANKVYVTVHESGNDNAIFISDGVHGWYRLNSSQFPNGNQVWSPFGNVANGAGAVLSIEVTKGDHRLLVGGIGSNTHILQRDFSVFTDDGAAYTCFGTLGSLNVASPGQIAGLTFANIRATRVGTSPIVSFLLNEVSGSFTNFPASQAYPWQIFGASAQPTSIFSNAYYFRAAGVPALAEHLQIKVSFPAENVQNEVLTLSLFGVVEQSPED